MLTLVAISLVLALIVAVVVKLSPFDGDLTLMWKGAPIREEVEDKVVWITGASRGIGEILAKQLCSLGAKLILSARSKSELERVKSELVGKYASHAEILLLDLASGEKSLGEAVLKAESFFNGAGVDYMIHNAAFERPKSTALDVSEESLETAFRINVLGTISLTRLLAPYMLGRGRGHFVVMSSAAGKTPAPGQAVYSATKFALNGYFHTLRSELYQKGLRVTVVCPGPIDTSKTGDPSSSSSFLEKRLTSERCAELTITAATHGLKEAWISNQISLYMESLYKLLQPVLLIMYLVQYMPSVGYWLLDKIGPHRIKAAATKKSTYSWKLLLGSNKEA